MVATAELQAAVREALRSVRTETDQEIWNEYFFGASTRSDEARSLEFERIRAAALITELTHRNGE